MTEKNRKRRPKSMLSDMVVGLILEILDSVYSAISDFPALFSNY